MSFCFRLACSLVLWVSWAPAQTTNRFRLWMAGQEVGGRETLQTQNETREGIETREWVRIERLGMAVEQKVNLQAFRDAEGALEFTWSIRLAQEPMEGRATWKPADPLRLRVQSKHLPERWVELEKEQVLWPPTQDAKLLEAAKGRHPLRLKGYVPALQQPTELDLEVVGPDPLPGFPDAVRFKGVSREGPMQSETELWVSPSAGELKTITRLGGIPILVQRAELPAPKGPELQAGFFAQTLKTLPPHPFLPWLTRATLRWDGKDPQSLPEDDQQKRLDPCRIQLQRAKAPTPEEAAQPPVKGKPHPEEAPFLAVSPLVQFEDPVFKGLLVRLQAPNDASRWALAQRVNRFVFEWITEKDYTVGFASAQEVARRPQGDCTEHGVLAVALLRKLGVPARGVLGWVGMGNVLGLHLWAEVKIVGRWIPMDPTFDEIPASTLRLKLGTTDLADLGSVGWDTAATRFGEGKWLPEGAWDRTIKIIGDRVSGPDGIGLRVTGGDWKLEKGVLTMLWRGSHEISACPRPTLAIIRDSKGLMAMGSRASGVYWAKQRTLLTELATDRWLQIKNLSESEAFAILDSIVFQSWESQQSRSPQ